MRRMELQPAAAGFDAARLDRIAAHLDRHYIEPGKIAGCQVAVGRHGHLAYHASLGQRDRERGVAIGDDTIFRIYSMTKPITSIALMQLFEQGMFQLDDAVARFVPVVAQPPGLRVRRGRHRSSPSRRIGRCRSATCSRTPAA